MKATAKYLFDEDFASREKPTITMVEHERRRADAESQAYRQGYTAGQEQAHQEATQRMADALSVIADGSAGSIVRSRQLRPASKRRLSRWQSRSPPSYRRR